MILSRLSFLCLLLVASGANEPAPEQGPRMRGLGSGTARQGQVIGCHCAESGTCGCRRSDSSRPPTEQEEELERTVLNKTTQLSEWWLAQNETTRMAGWGGGWNETTNLWYGGGYGGYGGGYGGYG